jgi:hypothetical protein
MILGVLPSITATAELVVPITNNVRILSSSKVDVHIAPGLTKINTDDLALDLLLTTLCGVPSPE